MAKSFKVGYTNPYRLVLLRHAEEAFLAFLSHSSSKNPLPEVMASGFLMARESELEMLAVCGWEMASRIQRLLKCFETGGLNCCTKQLLETLQVVDGGNAVR